jgi:lipoprotein-releasing system permease protein
MRWPDGAVQIARIQPRDPVRGIVGAGAMLDALGQMAGVAAAPTLRGQMILRHGGRDYAVASLGVDPAREARVSDIDADMVQGSLAALSRRSDGVIIGAALADKMGAGIGDVLIASTAESGAALRVVGIFRTGLEAQDTTQVYLALARQQSLLSRPRVVNQIHVRLDDIARSIPMARMIEARWGYKAAPWEETYSRILDVFLLQNIIMYTTTGAILVVAAFGIFNIIATVVLEKARDIAILRSIGMPAGEVVAIFVVEGAVVGVLGVLGGWLLGWLLTLGLEQIPAPGTTTGETLTVARSAFTYALASGIALVSSIGAAWFPARRAARTDPLAIIRGAT